MFAGFPKLAARGPLVAAVLFLGVLAGCTEANQWGLPRVAAVVVSPDGRLRAEVRNHPSIDPPKQSLWLVETETDRRHRLARLGEDTHWCQSISWSDDGSKVAFVLQDAYVALYDSESHEKLSEVWLVENDAYPTSREIVDLRLNSSGSQMEYRTCPRRSRRNCSEPRTALLADESAAAGNRKAG